ncbi:MAG: HEAT repeat domain-containing protein [Planctomycetota bacterium]|nr:HEAT repeat domain-containing protein [Planctomycetota bacterium]
MRVAIAIIAWTAGACCAPAWGDDVRAEAPPGFVVEKVASEPAVVFPMFACFDDRGRLFVAESSGLDLYEELQKQTRKCRVSMLEDVDGDGRFERSTVFADGLVFPMGLVWRDGALYVADPPDLITLRDTDGDGRADERKVILSGFGHLDNGSLHGLTFGPDGMLYMTTGNPDGYRLKQPDGSMLVGECGALLRCRPDGSHPQVIARGFENLVEIVFLPGGEIIGTDNWYRRPSGGLRDALVHLVEGGRYPLHERDVGTPHVVTGDWLPPVAMFPAVALSGLTRYEGASFPAELRGNLFAAQHNSRKVTRHVLDRVGATFRTKDVDFLTSGHPDFHPSDVLEDADGSLLIVDTGGWYVQHCPTGRIRNSRAPGGVYRVRHGAGAPLNDPWGLQIAWDTLPLADVAGLLQDPRPAVRRKAERRLAHAGEPAVEHALPLLWQRGAVAQSHAAWALAATGTEAALAPMRQLIRDDPNQLVVLRALASLNDKETAPALEHWMVRHEDPAVRLALAEALIRCGSGASVAVILEALARETEHFVQHALIVALHRWADRDQLAAALASGKPPVQRAALLLLDQPPHSSITAAQVVSHISSTHPELRKTAQNILRQHPDWVPEALAFFAAALRDPDLSAEDQRRLADTILAFAARQEVVDWLGDVLGDASAGLDVNRRTFITDTMARAGRPQLATRWIEPLKTAVADPLLRTGAVRAVATVQLPELDEQLLQLAADGSIAPQIRMDALRGVIERHPNVGDPALELLVSQYERAAPAPLRLAATEILAKAALAPGDFVRVLNAVRTDALASPQTLYPLLERSAKRETAQPLIDYVANAVKHGWRPDQDRLATMLSALGPSHEASSKKVLRFLGEERARQHERLTRFEPLLEGGDEVRGRAIYFDKKVACSTCHRIGDGGGVVGPDLTKVGAIRSGRDILESILFPSSTFAQGYENYIVKLRAGPELTGTISERTADGIVLRDSSGAERRLRAEEIAAMRRDSVSVMPQGLEGAMTPDELRDLMAFLQNLK